jgi:ubiquinone/menaquinone biosynthesis C-methylase UbiE
MKINIGSGGTKIDGFVTCDYDPLSDPDYLFNLEKDNFPFEDDSVEVVVAHHVLEHLGEGYFHCLKELYRVCKHGATIDIRVPHHRHDYFYDDPTHRRPITIGGLLLFSRKHNRLCREQGAASSRLGDYFKVDFEIVDYSYIPSQTYRNEFENEPREKVEKYLREHNNIIEELWVKLVVVKDGD